MREFIMSMKLNGEERAGRRLHTESSGPRRSTDPQVPTRVTMSRDNYSRGRDTIQNLVPDEFDDVTPTMPPTPSTPSEVGRVYVAPTPLPTPSEPEIEPESIKLARDIDPRKVTTKRKMGPASPSYAPPEIASLQPIVWRSRRVPALAWISGTLMFFGAVGLLAWPRARSETPAQSPSGVIARPSDSAASVAQTSKRAETGSTQTPVAVTAQAAPAAATRAAQGSKASSITSSLNSKLGGSTVGTSTPRTSASPGENARLLTSKSAKPMPARNATPNSNVGNTEQPTHEAPKRRQMIY